FAAIRTSGETAAEPDPQVLFEIMEELGVASGETLVVGDAILQPGGLPRKCRGSAGMAPILIGVRRALGQRRRAPRRQWFGIPIKRS
ncbi:MAG: hypothetical protein GY856_42740, partial [bacterium]|nr:hypothetical protein [bacterium]